MSAPTSSAMSATPTPEIHKLVLSEHHRGTGLLDRIAAGVNVFVGSMWVFVGVTIAIVVWLFAGNVVGFDKTPWPLLLTILNLPQLSIMISLQVSANLAQRTSDARALTDHNAIVELHKINLQQLELLKGQQKMLALLHEEEPRP
jgi:low affinity Fe/Cu permease